ncbi:MAG: hypothetical protein Q7K03_10430 [Dehalococcoidia bacterium]|nr:hypothetical protein [Dehalococcoidia bacterium]
MPLETNDFWVRLFVRIKATHELWGATQILREAGKQAQSSEYEDVPISIREAVPSLRTIERILERDWKKLTADEKSQYRSAAQEANELDQPWSIAASVKHRLPDSAMGDLIAVWKLTLLLKETAPYPLWTFTVRQARWVARLRAALPDVGTGLLYRWAVLYSRREHTAESQGRQLDTADLDAELAFQHWKSSLHEWEYEQAVMTGAVPGGKNLMSDGEVKVHKALENFPVPLGYFVSHGRGFLTDVGGVEVWQRSWWPQAESVMANWLRDITTKVKRWQGINWGSGGSLPGDKERQEWADMGRQLAALVLEHAEALQQYIDSAGESAKISLKLQQSFYVGARLFRVIERGGVLDQREWDKYHETEDQLYDELRRLPQHPDRLAKPVNGAWQAWKPIELLKDIGYDEKGEEPNV